LPESSNQLTYMFALYTISMFMLSDFFLNSFRQFCISLHEFAIGALLEDFTFM
jgi:hypothetical protein